MRLLGWGISGSGLRIPCGPPLTCKTSLEVLCGSDMQLGWRREHLEGQGDLVSRLITPIIHIVNPFIPIINLVTKSP